MLKSRKFMALPVFSLEEGKEIGRIKGLVINPQSAEVAALIVQRGTLFTEQKVIPYQRVVSAGDNALTIQKVSNAEKMTSLPQIVDLVKENVQLRGSRVITEGGTALGYVEEFFVDSATGKITAYEISGHFTEGILKGKAVLPAVEVRTIGKDVLVVHNGATDSLTRSETKLAEGMKNIKTGTSRMVQKAHKLYSNPRSGEVSPEEEVPPTPEAPQEPEAPVPPKEPPEPENPGPSQEHPSNQPAPPVVPVDPPVDDTTTH
jgi:uncharacterized protein YrrD